MSESINWTNIEEYVWKIKRHLMNRYGATDAEYSIEPLRWYISTGRASADFLHRLIASRPFMIARLLHKNGSYEEILERIKAYIYGKK